MRGELQGLKMRGASWGGGKMKAGWREMEKRGLVNGGGKRGRVDGGDMRV